MKKHPSSQSNSGRRSMFNSAVRKALSAGAIAGVVVGVTATQLASTVMESLWGDGTDVIESVEPQPLYWVAPMDTSYRRDKPGKSPMGMVLVPVYGADDTGGEPAPGTIKVSPEMVNNLGVRTARVDRKALHSQIKTVGYVRFDEDQLIHMHPRVEGWIEKLYVKAAGDPVIKGQPLYDIYSPALVNAQEELVLALGRKNQRLLRAAEDRLKALKLPAATISALKKTRKVKQYVTFFSPQSGVVDNLNIRQGFYVRPGTSMMSIGSLSQVWVEAEVFERQAAEVNVGDAVTMSLDFLPGKLWQGKVDYIYPTLDVRTRTLKVRLRFNNEGGKLKPNMFAKVVIHAKRDAKTLLVPQESVIRTGSMDRVVLALGGGRYRSVEVRLGRLGEHFSEILAGLNQGDRVVTSAQFLLDSESSKTADFRRMHNTDDSDELPKTVWVDASINSIMVGHRMVNVSHPPIAAWSWPAMEMDLMVASTVDLKRLRAGIEVRIKIEKTDVGSYEVIAVEFYSESVDDGQVSSSNMDSGTMDHKKIESKHD